jgi:hypothetical protein
MDSQVERLFDVVMCDSMPSLCFHYPGKERAAAIPNLPVAATDGAESELLEVQTFP